MQATTGGCGLLLILQNGSIQFYFTGGKSAYVILPGGRYLMLYAW
jgi:hypothetical protein